MTETDTSFSESEASFIDISGTFVAEGEILHLVFTSGDKMTTIEETSGLGRAPPPPPRPQQPINIFANKGR